MFGNVLAWIETIPSCLEADRIWSARPCSRRGLSFSGSRARREGRSVIPLAFWYCSLGGGVVLLAYAIHVGDAVFIVGQASGLVVYSRNLYLIFRERSALKAAASNSAT